MVMAMNALKLTKPTGAFCWLRLYRLYLRSFPANERKPFSVIYRKYRQGKNDVWCLMKGTKLMGLATTVNSPNLILLDYLAVSPKNRGEGIGSDAMESLIRHYSGKGLFVEIENTAPDGPDKEMRLRRKRFYENCGLAPMDVTANVFGVSMELMGCGCCLTFDAYHRFYHDHLGPWTANHILPET